MVVNGAQVKSDNGGPSQVSVTNGTLSQTLGHLGTLLNHSSIGQDTRYAFETVKECDSPGVQIIQEIHTLQLEFADDTIVEREPPLNWNQFSVGSACSRRPSG